MNKQSVIRERNLSSEEMVYLTMENISHTLINYQHYHLFEICLEIFTGFFSVISIKDIISI